jgi:hypothetical protein
VTRRVLPAVFCSIALLTLFLNQSPTSLGLVGLSVLALYLGYRRKGSVLPYLSSLLLYVPLAVTLSLAIGPVEGCIASASALALVSERMSFENDLSKVLEVPTGLDSEVSQLAARISSAHLQKLGIYGILILVVAGISLPLAGLTFYAPVLVSAAAFLMVVVYSYARSQNQPHFE